jgi:hypothetical protein
MAAHSGPNITGNTLTVDTTSGGVEVVGVTTYHKTVIVQNTDASVAIYVGSNSGLTTANGYRVAAGESFSIDLPPSAVLHAISGSTADARFLVVDGFSSF